ncbi:ATP/GTP-binding protein [Kribbella sindirgiensis]|nr:ATP/GTP-binding protein [Kribbella sindirgiensis]
MTRWIWLPGRPDTEAVDPVTLAYQAIGEMQLAPPLIKTAPAPGQIGLVNMPVWLWVTKTENTWGPIVRSARVPGLTVTVTAHVKAINWSMGDGKTVRCEGPGTPYNKSMGVKTSPTCGHRYVKTSRKLPNCKYPVAAVAQWDITWQSTLGDTGQIAMTQQATTQLRIGEAVPVLVDRDGGQTTPVAPEC